MCNDDVDMNNGRCSTHKLVNGFAPIESERDERNGLTHQSIRETTCVAEYVCVLLSGGVLNFGNNYFIYHVQSKFIRHEVKWLIILTFLPPLTKQRWIKRDRDGVSCDKIAKVIAVYSFDILPI